MIKKSLFTLAAAVALTTAGNATILNLSGDAMPNADGAVIPGGLIRLGTLNGTPASDGIADIEAQFAEFGTATIQGAGFTPNTFSSSTTRGNGDFDGQQVYIWVFDKGTVGDSSFHALFSVNDPDNPGEGTAWRFEPHVGNGLDAATLTVNAATLANADLSVTTGVDVAGNVINLQRFAPIPEPSGAILAGLAGSLLLFRRRR